MIVEPFLTSYTQRMTERSLDFSVYPKASLPKPKKSSRYLLYIHIPFCEELCPYCSFVSIKMQTGLVVAYFAALQKEITLYHQAGYVFDSVYIGGGTPTIAPENLEALIAFVKNRWEIGQISVETNPNRFTVEMAQSLKVAGVNRLSVGVQSFNDKILKSIKRFEHYGSGKEVRGKLLTIRGIFDTVNVDMIFNFPNQTEENLRNDIKILKEINADQITWYPLMVSEAKKGEILKQCGKVDYAQEKRFYHLIVDELTNDYTQKSVWCFSRKEGMIDEYILSHEEYAGVGRGSWGQIGGAAYSNTFSLEDYIKRLGENRHPIARWQDYSKRERMRQDFLLKLLDGNLSLVWLKKEYGPFYWFYLLGELLFFLAVGAIRIREEKIVLTPKGRYYWVVMMRTFFSVVGDYRERRTALDD